MVFVEPKLSEFVDEIFFGTSSTTRRSSFECGSFSFKIGL
jgi:hypothetical protein